MKLEDELKNYTKPMIHIEYVRLNRNFKEYDSITKNKMIEKIIEQLNNPDNIISLCTLKELKLLSKITSNEEIDLIKHKIEIAMLRKKHIILDTQSLTIPEELKVSIKKALKKVKWKDARACDRINELSVGIIKTYGELLERPLLQLTCTFLELDEEEVKTHFQNNKLFQFYVFEDFKYIENLNCNMPSYIYHDYYDEIEYLDNRRMDFDQVAAREINIKDYIDMFYYGLNINNHKVRKLYNIIAKTPIEGYLVGLIAKAALLIEDNDNLIDMLSYFCQIKEQEEEEFTEIVLSALDEIPSGALNGVSVRQHHEAMLERDAYEEEKLKSYVEQTDAHLPEKEVKLFYKLYFALLEYTNDMYHITKLIKKIYKQTGLNVNLLTDIVEYFWEHKLEIIPKFIKENKYKFNLDELNIIDKFKEGIRDNFILAAYEEEYTIFIDKNKAYMVKGLTSNIDEIIPFDNLPIFVSTTILPFKEHLIFDSILANYPINFGPNFAKTIQKDLKTMLKYYHI